MDFRISATWIFFFCNVVCPMVNIEAVVTQQLFVVNADQKQVEKKVDHFLRYKESILGKAGKTFKLNILHMKNVCDIDWNLRVILCEQALEIDSNGFKLAPSKAADVQCEETNLNVKFPTLGTLALTKLNMFSCPTVSYTDLETGAEQIIPYVYRISVANKHTSAILLVHERPTTPTRNPIEAYTQAFIQKLSFDRLKTVLKHKNRSEPHTEARLIMPNPNGDDSMRNYVKAKQINSPYKKFIAFYSSINVCGRPRSQNVHFCRHSIMSSLRMKNIKFDLRGYDQVRCQKYRVNVIATEYPVDGDLQVDLLMFRCPTVKGKYLPEKHDLFRLIYLVSNLVPESATLFIRDNLRGDLPVQQALNSVYHFEMRPIDQDVRRRRFMPRPLNDFSITVPHRRKPIEVPEPVVDVRSLSTLIAYYRANRHLGLPKAKTFVLTDGDRWRTDEVVISFSQVKNMKLVYQRFMKTHKSIDMCLLSVKQKAAHCEAAFQDYLHPRGHSLIWNGTLKFPCRRRQAALTTRDSTHLETNIYSMWECPNVKTAVEERYYVGKNHDTNSAIVYRAVGIRWKTYYYPYALMSEINRYMLARAEIEAR